MKNKILLTACFLIAIIILAGGVMACSIGISNSMTQLRSNTDGYAEEIRAENNSPIDIKTSFTVDSVSGSDCSNTIYSRAKIYRYNDTNGGWDEIKTTTSQGRTLSADDFIFTWPDEFTASETYQKYKVDGQILDGNTVLDTTSGYVYIGEGECTGIELTTKTINVDEGSDATETFKIKNTTGTDFRIENADVTFSSSLISSGHVWFDSRTVESHSTVNVDVEVEAIEVTTDRSTSGTFKVSGYLGNTFCSYTSIGQKNFSVNIKNLEDEGEPSADCADLSLHTADFSINEGETLIQSFYLSNDSERKFEITEIRLSSEGVDLSEYYYKPAIPSGEIGDILIKADASTNVNYDQTYSNTIEVEGKFGDGKRCSFNSIGGKGFKVTIKNVFSEQAKPAVPSQSSYAGYENYAPSSIYLTAEECKNFSILAINNVSVNGSGNVPITIKNGTGKRVTIIVESNAKTDPSQISVPEYTYITREISFEMNTREGEIKLIPQMDGCAIASTTISIHNNSNVIGGTSGGTGTGGSGSLLGSLFSLGTSEFFGALALIGLVALAILIIGQASLGTEYILSANLTAEEIEQLKRWKAYGENA
ncbi:MAG: hypothetical protein NTZ73_01955 [Candidatus Diapherotrites archaeon]|nr:hypothetical protein [Candidatus Diapherotrites archaeon]